MFMKADIYNKVVTNIEYCNSPWCLHNNKHNKNEQNWNFDF